MSEERKAEGKYTVPETEGQRYVYNRTNETYELFFDGRPITFQPHQVRLLPTATAEHIRAHSIIPGTLRRMSGGQLTAERALALGPGWALVRFNKVESESDPLGNAVYVPEYVEAEAEPEFLKPTDTKPGKELFDTESIPNYVDLPGPEGQATHRAYVRV
jgi:hypothetical protein